MASKFKIHNRMLIASAVLLSLIGLVMQYSASSYGAASQFGDAFYYVKKQAIALVFALVGQISQYRLAEKVAVYSPRDCLRFARVGVRAQNRRRKLRRQKMA